MLCCLEASLGFTRNSCFSRLFRSVFVGGYLADRFGRKLPIILASALFVMGGALLVCAPKGRISEV